MNVPRARTNTPAAEPPRTRMSAPLSPQLLDRPASDWLHPVRQLLDEQVELCLAFEQMSTRQTELIAAGLVDDMLALLTGREGLLERIVEIHHVLEPFHARHAELVHGLSNSDRVSIQGRIDAVASVIERIRLRDDADRRTLEQQRQAVADELAGMARLRGAAAAYAGGGAQAPTASRFGGQRG